MTFRPADYDPPLERAFQHARSWLAAETDRPVRPADDIETILAYLTKNYGPPQSAGRAGQPR